MKSVINTPKAAAAAGPYSQGISFGDLVFVSGQLPLDLSGNMPEGIEAQTRQSLANVAAILEAAGASLASVVKTTVFLNDIKDFAVMNGIYAEHFKELPPARSAFQVGRLPKDALVEVEVIAVRNK